MIHPQHYRFKTAVKSYMSSTAPLDWWTSELVIARGSIRIIEIVGNYDKIPKSEQTENILIFKRGPAYFVI